MCSFNITVLLKSLFLKQPRQAPAGASALAPHFSMIPTLTSSGPLLKCHLLSRTFPDSLFKTTRALTPSHPTPTLHSLSITAVLFSPQHLPQSNICFNYTTHQSSPPFQTVGSRKADVMFSCSVLHPEPLEQCMVHSMCSIKT